ncbi:MAG TPA: hypothetical protein VFH38_07370 [Jatrophihabitans sp.]|nr:hypothetical protein [Jatrophihabitans sp.]
MSSLYEMSIRGLLPAEVMDDLPDARRVEHPTETLLVTEPLDPDAVLALVRRLTDLGLELEEVRRLEDPHAAGGAPDEPDEGERARGGAA